MQHEKLLFGALAVIGVGLIVFLIVARGRISHAGSFDDYHAGHALALGEGKLGWALAADRDGRGHRHRAGRLHLVGAGQTFAIVTGA